MTCQKNKFNMVGDGKQGKMFIYQYQIRLKLFKKKNDVWQFIYKNTLK